MKGGTPARENKNKVIKKTKKLSKLSIFKEYSVLIFEFRNDIKIQIQKVAKLKGLVCV